MTLFNELKRRNVFRVGIAYVIAAWLIAQVLQLVFESFGTPDWVMKTVLVLLAASLPVVLFFAWAFEITPEGIKRESEVDRSQSITTQTGRKLNGAITGVLVVALAYFIFDKFVLDASRDAALVEATRQEVSEQAAEIAEAPVEMDKSIAVLPFVNMSGDQENEYFSDGLTEELLNALARNKELKVTGRTSSFAFKGKNTDLREIGQTLGVAHILAGSVRKAQNRVRITAQLIKADDGYHMWSDTFDRELNDIFAIQEEIATRVANELMPTLLGDTEGQLVHRDTDNVQAYEAYLRGQYLFERNSDDIKTLQEAERLFEQSLILDPQFTLAWYGRFRVLNFMFRNGFIDYQEGALQLMEMAEKMAEIDSRLPESHVALGRAAMIEMRWPEAETAYNQALILNPGNINALNALSSLLTIFKRNEEALVYGLRALERDPLNLRALISVTNAYSYMGRCEDAKQIMERALSLVPDAGRFHQRLADCYFHNGDFEKALGLSEKETVGFLGLTGLAIGYNKLGQQDKAQHYLEELIEADGEQASYQYGQIYAQWGETDKALDALEHAWDIGDAGVVLLSMDGFLDPIRDQPRFKALMEKWQDPAKR